jgi:hypothetical protein
VKRIGDPLGPKKDQVKVPFAFDLTNGGMMAFAGLWDAWKDPANGQWLQSYTIITTDANELMAPVHDRMPVILHPGDFNRWLDREPTDQPPIDLGGVVLHSQHRCRQCCAPSPPTRWKPLRHVYDTSPSFSHPRRVSTTPAWAKSITEPVNLAVIFLGRPVYRGSQTHPE